ncbi:MAG: pimeloyl-CoA dehydrogenase large subunit [Rhodobiaceae bacterium]|nr:MAG: pimeloyl-CoA dehydrogenase large subunit [Rhodobiaceae bacterium]
MDLSLKPEDEVFRNDVRTFLQTTLPDDVKSAPSVGVSIEKPLLKKWHSLLADKGWAAPHWPREHGGTGWSITQKHIWEEETSQAGAPRLMAFGLSMVAPVIYTFGNEDQKAQHLPGILNGDVWWCQGYSEPGAGSDLSSLQTKAVRDGDEYVVTGQKIWTSYAHEADWIFCLVRTDDSGKQQEGISFLLIDMKTPGIEVKPIVSIDGLHHLNEVFFTDVRVPIANLIGEEGKGWTYAKFLLANERTGIAGVSGSKKAVQELRSIAMQEAAGDGAPLWAQDSFRHKLTEIEVKLQGLEYTNLRILADVAAGKAVGAESSILKIIGSEVQQELAILAVEVVQHYALPSHVDDLEGRSNQTPVGPDYSLLPVANMAFGRASSIYGGSNEVQRNVIAKAVLGL